MTDAIDVIQQDHLNVDRLLKILEDTVASFQSAYTADDKKPDLDLLFTIIYYIRTFPDSIHHPKEEKHLFPALLARAPEAKGLIDLLHDQHEKGEKLIRDLSVSLEAFDKEFPSGVDDLQDAVKGYIYFQRQHIGLEERELLPLARIHPILGDNLERGFKMLFDRIATEV